MVRSPVRNSVRSLTREMVKREGIWVPYDPSIPFTETFDDADSLALDFSVFNDPTNASYAVASGKLTLSWQGDGADVEATYWRPQCTQQGDFDFYLDVLACDAVTAGQWVMIGAGVTLSLFKRAAEGTYVYWARNGNVNTGIVALTSTTNVQMRWTRVGTTVTIYVEDGIGSAQTQIFQDTAGSSAGFRPYFSHYGSVADTNLYTIEYDNMVIQSADTVNWNGAGHYE